MSYSYAVSKYISDSTGRLDAFLAKKDSNKSRTQIQKSIVKGSVTVNGTVVNKPAFVLQNGDVILVKKSEVTQQNNAKIVPVDLSLSVLYEDNSCLVINKPARVSVHPASSMKENEVTLLHGIAHLFAQRGIAFSSDSVLVHRLDKDTTGCILLAKNAKSHAYLQKQFEQRTVQKHYLAIVAGVPKNAKAMIDSPIGRNLTNRMQMSVMRTAVSREAQTSYEVLDATDDSSLLSCNLHTGRTHQIRVHLSSIRHPLLGDEVYGSAESKKLSKKYGIDTVCLHSRSLSFHSPDDGKAHSVSAPLPEHFVTTAKRVGLHLSV